MFTSSEDKPDRARGARQRARIIRWGLLAAGGLVIGLGIVLWSVPPGPNPAATKPDREAAENYAHEARRLASEQRVGEALELLARAKKLAPDWSEPYLLRAELFVLSSRMREAYGELRTAFKLAPNDPQIALSLVRYGGPFIPAAEAEAIARHAVTLDPQSKEAHYYLGMSILNSGDPKRYAEALKAFMEANRISPYDPMVLLEMGKIYIYMGQDIRALAALEGAWQILEESSRHKTMHEDTVEALQLSTAFWLRQIYLKMGRKAEAKALAQRIDRLSAQFRKKDTLAAEAVAGPR